MLENAEVGLSASLHLLPACGSRCHRVMCEMKNVCRARAIEAGKCWPDIAVQSIVTLSPEMAVAEVGPVSHLLVADSYELVAQPYVESSPPLDGLVTSKNTPAGPRASSEGCWRVFAGQRRIPCEGPRPLLPGYLGRPLLTVDMEGSESGGGTLPMSNPPEMDIGEACFVCGGDDPPLSFRRL
jgi:hypothetical protein